MSKIRDTDYLTISARVRAMENRLVTRERMERMVEARSDDEAVKVLAECGYEELPALTNRGLDELLSAARTPSTARCPSSGCALHPPTSPRSS